MKKRILTGITTTGTPHIGNYLGAIKPALKLAGPETESFFFLADYHALIKQTDASLIEASVKNIALAWLSAGLDSEHSNFYRQSDIPEVHELTWILSCSAAKGLLNRAHAYKAVVAENEASNADDDKAISMGLFSYPVLMAADILLYDANIIPVGKDQLQHIEMTRDVASRFHAKIGKTFVIPEAEIQHQTMYVPGTNGGKMSKSQNNIINLFLPDKQLRKQIMSIATDSTPMEDSKDWKSCNCFAIFTLVADEQQIADMKDKYERGDYGYGHAKQALFELLIDKFSTERTRYNHYMNNLSEIDEALAIGAEKAKVVADTVLKRVRTKVGY